MGWSASRSLRFAIPFSLGVCHARDEVTNLVHFKQFTDVQLVGGLGSLRGRVSDLFPPPSWRRDASWMCDLPSPLPMRGGALWRVVYPFFTRPGLAHCLSSSAWVRGFRFSEGGLPGGRAAQWATRQTLVPKNFLSKNLSKSFIDVKLRGQNRFISYTNPISTRKISSKWGEVCIKHAP